MSDKTFIVTKEEMDPKMYELLMLDVERIRKSYGKEYTNKGKVAGMTVRCGVRYWLTSNESGELTIEQYKHAKETYKR
jgi:hypothetical protein